MNYKLIITVTSESLSELVEYTHATPGATLESVAKGESSNGNGVTKLQQPEPGMDPRLVLMEPPDYPSCPSKRIIDVDASLNNIGLSRDQLMSHPAKSGTIEHSIKRALQKKYKPQG